MTTTTRFQNALPTMTPARRERHIRAMEILDSKPQSSPSSTTRQPANINLLTGDPLRTEKPTWLKKAEHEARKHEAYCKGCKTQYLKGELNTAGLCNHCADDLS